MNLIEQTVIDRFYKLIEKTDSCWIWKAHCSRTGYGQFKFKRRQFLAHRVSYMIHMNSDPGSLFVCHRCDIRNCVNPAHLFLGTAKDNMEDKMKKGRSHKGMTQSNRREFCNKNHRITGDVSDRKCRDCRREWERNYWHRVKKFKNKLIKVSVEEVI